MATPNKKSLISKGNYKKASIPQRLLTYLLAGILLVTVFATVSTAQTAFSASKVCAIPTAGSIVTNPPEIRNLNASRPVNFSVRNISELQDCYVANGEMAAPTLRVNPSAANQTMVLNLTNKLPKTTAMAAMTDVVKTCAGGMPPQNSTNLHFHGLNVSPQCHQDEVVKTVIQPGETFDYKVKIPGREPPGLYWYHPHIHKQSQKQVLKGLTGVLIVEGMGKFYPRVAKLPERVFVLRDMRLLPSIPEDNQAPAKDISLNSVPIRYRGSGRYDPPAVVQIAANQEQFWRVANTAADTYFDLQLKYDGTPQPLDLVAMDGIPMNADPTLPKNPPPVHIVLPPGGRAEFIIKGPSPNVKNAEFMTLNFDTNADKDPERILAKIQLDSRSPTSLSKKEADVDYSQVYGDRFSGLSQANYIRERTLYFSQNDQTNEFYITEKGKQPQVYDMNAKKPNITLTEGITEDWIVENRAQEAHAFHIHQIHFLVLKSPENSDVGMLRDTISIPAWDGKSTTYPQVRLRMDFRGKGSSIAGTFVYHCHILEHEDGGMMGSIEVLKKA